MNQFPEFAEDVDHALFLASKKMNIAKDTWILNGNISNLLRQKTLSEFF